MRAPDDGMELTDRVRGLADEAAADRGLFVVDVRVRGQKGSRVIEVFVDSDQGPGLDELAELSRDLDFVLETEDVIKGRYYLNVSSPGADRPLMLPRQYRKHLGRNLHLVVSAVDGEAAVTGKLLGVNDRALELEVDGETTTIPFDDVREARVLLPW